MIFMGMKKRRVAILTTLSALLLHALVGAQQPASAPGTGTITGRVTCADTQRPARFASVTLFGVPKEATPPPKLDPSMDSAAMMAAMKSSFETSQKTTMAQTQSDIGGAFVATDLAPGDYYVFAAAAGYVGPLSVVKAALNTGADAHLPLPGVVMVHVTAEHAVNADVTIERGAAVSGTVMWDDGTPISGASVAMTSAKGDEKEIPAEFEMLQSGSAGSNVRAITDDLGHFRVSGFVAGDYLVQVRLLWAPRMNLTNGSIRGDTMFPPTPLVVFAPAAFHKTDAKTITLHRAEDRREVQITVNLGGMHSVSGRIGSAEDHHGLNSATVKLTDAQDKEFVRAANVDAAGNFTVTLVPPGTYDLTVSDAADTVPDKRTDEEKAKLIRFTDSHAVRSYEDGKQPVIIGDSDGGIEY